MLQPKTSPISPEFYYRATPRALRATWIFSSSAAVWVVILVLGWPNQHWGVVLLGTVCILGSLSFAILPLLHYVRVTSAGIVYKPVYEQEFLVPHESLSSIEIHGNTAVLISSSGDSVAIPSSIVEGPDLTTVPS